MIIKRLTQVGDTIVEVLIAITVVSVILGGAFVSVSRSQSATRAAQERIEALKVAENQTELLKKAASEKSPDIFGNNFYCLSGSSPITLNAFSPSAMPASNDDYPVACRSGSIDGSYNVSVEHNVNDFRVRVLWDRNNGGQEQLEIDYRVLQ